MYPYGLQDKKALNMLILEILEQYTDSDHPLTQMEIVDLLEKTMAFHVRGRQLRIILCSWEKWGMRFPWRAASVWCRGSLRMRN